MQTTLKKAIKVAQDTLPVTDAVEKIKGKATNVKDSLNEKLRSTKAFKLSDSLV